MSATYRDAQKGKFPQYNAKTTPAATQRVLRMRCNRSNAYLFNFEQGQRRVEFYQRQEQTGNLDQDELAAAYSQVAHDNLMYGMETSLKAAQMIDGYHEFNKGSVSDY